MENFDQKIRNKLFSLEYEKAPNVSLMSGMFEQLEQSQIKEVPVIELEHTNNARNLYGTYIRIAAAVVFLIVAGFSFYQVNEVNLYASKGSNLTHQFPDGSSVNINADSKLAYNKLSWFFNRSVSMDGEAFFEVEKGEPFTVFSELGSTSVLGTSFNIYSRAQDYNVACITGSVKVSLGEFDDIILTPGNGVRFSNDEKGTEYSLNEDHLADWRSGEFFFDNEPLINVVATLSRQYNIEVRLAKRYEQNKYTGYFNDKNLETALKIICDPSELEFQIIDGYVVIK